MDLAFSIFQSAKASIKLTQLLYVEATLIQMCAKAVSMTPCNDEILGNIATSDYSYSGSQTTNVGKFNDDLRSLLDKLKADAASEGALRKFASGNAPGPDFITIYAIMQCRPDQSDQDCISCLDYIMKDIQRKMNGFLRGSVVDPMCNFQYSDRGFFNERFVNPPPPSSSLSSPPEKHRDNCDNIKRYDIHWCHNSCFNLYLYEIEEEEEANPRSKGRKEKKLTLANGEWISEPHRVKNDFFTHFKKQFSPIQAPSICFDFTFPTCLSSDQVQDLERPFTYEEVKRAVWDYGTNKSPGPDGFSFEFYRKYWTTIDDDVFQAVRDFFVNGHFPRGCNSSFIALIPKIQDAKFVKDFRPISLIGSVYKIIAKILDNRLCLVLPYLISDVQSAFVANRQILDGPFILNELLSWCKFKKLNGMIFKVDFEKAFDSVKWDYLDETLKAFGFGLKWRNWISSCLNNAMGSMLVNGSPTLEFQFHKGLKQGDLISPFLFILIMETLHLTFKRVLNAGLYKGISLNDSFTISHLFYADDVVFIGEWNNNNIQTLLSVLRCFYLASGLKINLHKSKLMGIGVSSNVVAAAASLIGCSILTAPFNYLGVKVGSNMSRINSWDDVISKVSSRLSKWKLKLLSIGGRLTLLKSVLTSIPLYHMSIFKVPIGVLNHLESIRRNFFYGVDGSDRKLAWIGWNMVLTSKKNGGLGVSSFFAHNRALLFKWVWRFLTDGSSLWTRFIKAIFGNKGALDTHKLIPRRSPWQDVILAIHSLQSKGINLMDFIQKKVGNGENTSFWDDSWLGEVALKVLYKRLYALEMCKSISVAEKMGHPSLSHSFRRMPRGGVEQENYGLLCSKVADLVLPNISDRWCWSLEGSQEFSVKSSRILIDNTILPKAEVPTRWLRVVPIKVNVHAWRVCLDKLPTRANLSLRGMDIPSIACPLCNSAVESTSHIFFACPLARQVWRKILIWWELEDVAFNSYNEWLNWIVNIRLHKQLKVFLEAFARTIKYKLKLNIINTVIFTILHMQNDEASKEGELKIHEAGSCGEDSEVEKLWNQYLREWQKNKLG
ncbi:RNA-directed DNA polymerase, eukaryota, reverse transcriptase zinc-binding domain protein [Tanacetum coccineum]|uniref:RNA-directed DNA polymerase, eukaryota, reverse transcriptase zinc-binding domain protein n=1 Tax=Tanacetum coccineum TaxID=301880 RepID=A0ABQ5HZR3_9ASTR